VGSFFVVSKDQGNRAANALEKSRAHFARTGFSSPITFEDDAYTLDYYGKIQYDAKNYHVFENGDFAVANGTFIYKGKIGADALKAFADEGDHEAQLRNTRGHFVVIIRKNGRTRLYRDPLGAHDVFLTQDGRCATSSFIAAASVSERLTVSPQECYEYVFNGCTLGNETPFAEIRRLDLFESAELSPRIALSRRRQSLLPDESGQSRTELVTQNLHGLLQYTSDLVGLFGSNVKVALSGGYDSRFLLALFRKCGITPHLFVYGGSNDEDVLAAKRIGEAEGIEINHVDKSHLKDVTPEEFPEIVESIFLRDDCMSSGGIFSNGGEQIARVQRNAGGALHVNGGGGEVYRNFFNLFDRSLTPRQFVWTFYTQYDPADCAGGFTQRGYEDAVSAKVKALFGTNGNSLSRRQVEALYPYFRCRSWFGRENSVNSRYGYSVLPFFDYQTVHEALQIPVGYKKFGDFEAALIRQTDPSLARHMSLYGFDFTNDAPARARLNDTLTYMRPPYLRGMTYRLKSRLGSPETRPPLHTEPYLRGIIDTSFPYMSKYFDVAKVKADIQFARICTLEYLFARFNPQAL